jgi:hypothetical protein
MTAHGRAVYEESVAGDLIKDLAPDALAGHLSVVKPRRAST